MVQEVESKQLRSPGLQLTERGVRDLPEQCVGQLLSCDKSEKEGPAPFTRDL